MVLGHIRRSPLPVIWYNLLHGRLGAERADWGSAIAEIAPQRVDPTPVRRLLLIVVPAAVVTAALAVFGVEHTPNYTLSLFGTSGAGAISLKSKIANAVLGLALLQLLLALWMYGRLPA